MFNSVQLKCFMVMKLLKNEVINNELKEDVLTSYHCKTCILCMIEATPSNFWIPANSLFMSGQKKKKCPNYFIPKENMFDRLESMGLELLASTLQSLLSEH